MIKRTDAKSTSRILETAELLEKTALACKVMYGDNIAYAGLVYAMLAVAVRSQPRELILEYVSTALDDIDAMGGSDEMDRILNGIAEVRMGQAMAAMGKTGNGQAEQN